MVTTTGSHTVWVIRWIVSPGGSRAKATLLAASDKVLRAAGSLMSEDSRLLSCFTRAGTFTPSVVEAILTIED